MDEPPCPRLSHLGVPYVTLALVVSTGTGVLPRPPGFIIMSCPTFSQTIESNPSSRPLVGLAVPIPPPPPTLPTCHFDSGRQLYNTSSPHSTSPHHTLCVCMCTYHTFHKAPLPSAFPRKWRTKEVPPPPLPPLPPAPFPGYRVNA